MDIFESNLRKAKDISGLTVKEIADKSGVKITMLNEWFLGRTKMAKADDLYKVCKVLGTTVEEIVDGEEGKEYVTTLVISEGTSYRAPPHIADIVDQLVRLDEKELGIIRGTLSGILGEKPASAKTAGAS